MRECFQKTNFRPSSLTLITQANEIIEQYQADRIQLTLRQLYYQFVSRNWLANSDRNYKNLGNVLSEGRLSGLVDWSAIDDLGRVPSIPSWDENLTTFIEQMKQYATAYSLDRWRGQEFYVELHVEKQALSSVLRPIADQFGVGFSMNRGYSSQTAFYDASKRFIEAAEAGKHCVCIYAGDLDPSGEDMVRDFRDRMAVFGADVEIDKVALTMEQVRQYRCPPNPLKTKDGDFSDARARGYVQKFGRESWEIDALDPKILRKIVSRALTARIDESAMIKVLAQEKRERAVIAKALSRISTGAR